MSKKNDTLKIRDLEEGDILCKKGASREIIVWYIIEDTFTDSDDNIYNQNQLNNYYRKGDSYVEKN